MFNYKIKKLLFIILILSIFVSAIVFGILQNIKSLNPIRGNNVVINNVTINVMVADEISEYWQGLSDRQFMGAHDGMLFLFPAKYKKTFVMRRMHFPLDIIWIADDTIVKISKKLEPEGTNPIKKYNSDLPVNRVLEVNGGFTDAFNIKIGDKIKLNLE